MAANTSSDINKFLDFERPSAKDENKPPNTQAFVSTYSNRFFKFTILLLIIIELALNINKLNFHQNMHFCFYIFDQIRW